MYNMNLIINTHWDREYRWSFSETQLRLGEAVDDLIDIMQKNKDFKYFHTDSQVSMLDDYLELRPERTDELKELVREGRILTGPWYTLPAEYLVSGEALVRNLNMGHKIAKKLGKVMKAAYNIFSWGQVSQLPQLYRQFGMNTILFYRGINQTELDSLEFKWKAPDGTEALAITFGACHRLNFWRYVYIPYIMGGKSMSGDNYGVCRDSLGNAFLFEMCDKENSLDEVNHQVINQPTARDTEAALSGLDKLVDTVKDKTSIDELLFLQGFDQENPDPIVTEILDKINADGKYGKISVASLEDYVKVAREKIEKTGIYDKLETRTGEMLAVEKTGDAFGPLYNGVWSSRMPVKLQNSNCQYLLETWAEPAAIWNMTLGHSYPVVSLDKAWKQLLKNQQHDGIGGCHVDRVSKTMFERYRDVSDVAESVIKTSLRDITAKIDFSRVGKKEIGVCVFNSTQYVRNDTISLTVDVPRDWGFRYNGNTRRDFSFEVRDAHGNLVRNQVLNIEDDYVFGYLKFGNVIGYDASRCTIALDVSGVPAMGYTTFTVTPVKYMSRPTDVLCTAPNTMENDKVKIVINANGSINFTDKKTGREFDNIAYFEDAGDKGGPLKFDKPYEMGLYTTLSQTPDIELTYNGPLYAQYKITYNWLLPESIMTDLKIHVPHGSEWIDQGRLKRSDKKNTVKITSKITLRHNSDMLEFDTTVDNQCRDHRLRVMFPTELSEAMYCYADSPFDVVRREITIPDSTGWYEGAALEWPSESFVSVKGDKVTATLCHHGIPEYEVVDNKQRTIALTLLRCISTAGNPTETFRYQELAECIGEHNFKYSFCADKTEDAADYSLLRRSLLFNVPLRAAQTTTHEGTLATEKSFYTVSAPEFVVTAVKKAERTNEVIVRGYNASENEITMEIKVDGNVKSAKKVTLEELDMNNLEVKNNTIKGITVGKREIASICIDM